MRTAFALIILLASTGVTSGLAQVPEEKKSELVVSSDGGQPVPPKNRRRATVAEVLKGQPVPSSFDVLTGFLNPGCEVVVWDAAGHKRRGWVSALSSDQIVIFTHGNPPFLRPFAADSVRRIDIVDSTANGVLLGAVVGTGIMTALVQANKEDLRTSNLKPVGYTFLGVLSFVPSIYVGLLIDRMNNAPVYERRFQASRITFGPIVGGQAAGIRARVRF